MAILSPLSLIGVCLHLVTIYALRNSTIAEAFPQLVLDFPDFQKIPPTLTKAYTFGRQDMRKCCSLAVLESIVQKNNTICLANRSFIGNDLDSFRDQEYPCGANYIGDRLGAPLVTVPYVWCLLNCPGWQRSDSKKPRQWLLPVVGFIAPSVVFCLSIPRR